MEKIRVKNDIKIKEKSTAYVFLVTSNNIGTSSRVTINTLT